MDEYRDLRAEVDRFILEKIDSVPHLEALLLLWHTKPQRWTVETVSQRLYVKGDDAKRLLQDLRHRNLIIQAGDTPPEYSCEQVSPQQAQLFDLLDQIYRQELIRISTMIHSKGSKAIREFARAFRLKKEHD